MTDIIEHREGPATSAEPVVTVTTLGTSHGTHTPSRFNSSTLFEVRDSLYLVDAGAPVEGLLIRAGKDISRIRAVFLTHMHNDHVGGLPGLIKQLIKQKKDGQHTDVYLPEAAAHAGLNGWLQAQHLVWPSPCITMHTTVPNDLYDDGLLSVSAITTRHLVVDSDLPSSFSYELKTGGKSIVYTGDLSGDFSDFPLKNRVDPCDVCICEGTHYSMERALPVLAKAPIRKLILNHVGDRWHGEGEAELLALLSDLPFPCELAGDGSVFQI